MVQVQIKIGLEELYQMVWSTPKIKLAKQFNITDRGIAKLCEKHKIPLLELGYWVWTSKQQILWSNRFVHISYVK